MSLVLPITPAFEKCRLRELEGSPETHLPVSPRAAPGLAYLKVGSTSFWPDTLQHQAPRTYLCFAQTGVISNSENKIGGKVDCGSWLFRGIAGECSCKVNNHPRFIYFMTLIFCVSRSLQARHTLILSFPTAESLCWVSGLKCFCHNGLLSLRVPSLLGPQLDQSLPR